MIEPSSAEDVEYLASTQLVPLVEGVVKDVIAVKPPDVVIHLRNTFLEHTKVNPTKRLEYQRMAVYHYLNMNHLWRREEAVGFYKALKVAAMGCRVEVRHGMGLAATSTMVAQGSCTCITQEELERHPVTHSSAERLDELLEPITGDMGIVKLLLVRLSTEIVSLVQGGGDVSAAGGVLSGLLRLPEDEVLPVVLQTGRATQCLLDAYRMVDWDIVFAGARAKQLTSDKELDVLEVPDRYLCQMWKLIGATDAPAADRESLPFWHMVFVLTIGKEKRVGWDQMRRALGVLQSMGFPDGLLLQFETWDYSSEVPTFAEAVSALSPSEEDEPCPEVTKAVLFYSCYMLPNPPRDDQIELLKDFGKAVNAVEWLNKLMTCMQQWKVEKKKVEDLVGFNGWVGDSEEVPWV